MWLAGLIVCLGWIVSLCFHEFSHALVAYWGGDTTVKDKGYLTFNPLKYTEPGLSLILPLVFVLIGGIGLPGGAVYINRKLLRDRAWSSWVSAAGPISSALFALFLVAILRILSANYSDREWAIIAIPSLAYLIYLEWFAVLFNLFPIPPLDGSGIIKPWLPDEVNRQMNKYSNYGYYFIFGLFWFVPGFGRFFSRISKSACEALGVPNLAIRYGGELFSLPINKLMAILIIVIIGYALRFNEVTWYKKGQKLALRKKDEEAIIAYDRALKIKPNYVDAWLNKAHALSRLNKDREAILAYQTAFNLGNEEDFKSNLKYLAQALINTDRDSEAIALIDKRIAIDPDEDYYWELKAFCLYKQKEYQSVVNICRQGLKIFENNKYLRYYLAAALKESGEYDAAQEAFARLLAIETDNITALSAQAHIYYLQQNYLSAIATFQKITEVEPDNSTAWYNLGCCYALQKDTKKAIAALHSAAKLDPQSTIQLAKEDPDFEILQQEPDFITLLTQNSLSID